MIQQLVQRIIGGVPLSREQAAATVLTADPFDLVLHMEQVWNAFSDPAPPTPPAPLSPPARPAFLSSGHSTHSFRPPGRRMGPSWLQLCA